jgi:hypothetical protein
VYIQLLCIIYIVPGGFVEYVEGIALSYMDMALVFMSLCLHKKRDRVRLAKTLKHVLRIKAFIRFTMICPVKIRYQTLDTAYTEQELNKNVLL